MTNLPRRIEMLENRSPHKPHVHPVPQRFASAEDEAAYWVEFRETFTEVVLAGLSDEEIEGLIAQYQQNGSPPTRVGNTPPSNPKNPNNRRGSPPRAWGTLRKIR